MFDPDKWMWERARAMLARAEQLHRGVFGECSPTAPPDCEPPIDVFETADAVWVLVALPGVEPRQLETRLHGAELVIRAERTIPATFRNARVLRLEIPCGTFERRLRLPAGAFETIEQELLNGCLFLRLRKGAER